MLLYIYAKMNLIKQPLYPSHIPPAPNIQNTSSELLSSLFPLPQERDKTHRTPPHPYEESACMTHTRSDTPLKMTGQSVPHCGSSAISQDVGQSKEGEKRFVPLNYVSKTESEALLAHTFPSPSQWDFPTIPVLLASLSPMLVVAENTIQEADESFLKLRYD